ncbi:TAP-like protein-domain-containing protein [Talaromyces proteolyticus]|uniref:TAP-like protein-domain-containing protein n=1 Tax=Talaromyces proteolyticus TaxID=1131652 RepID=A0AAD4KG87_9EURO|nr:TAP-like protein-domain-containing protein [Talaromyces proteolyticus]KAH8690470.1 TAP-like protein-domain-containing protein [Talaromyces proteolyticus]
MSIRPEPWLILGALLLGLVTAITNPDSTSQALRLDWEAISPSRDLTYYDCYDGFQCARLEVPLDWANSTDNRTAIIAIAKLPAVVSDSDPSFGGSIFVNPGGPGASGVSFIQRAGHNLQNFVDKPSRRHYEIVSWDPRGIGHTTPSSDCFHSNLMSRNAWLLEERGNGGLDKGLGAIKHGLSMTKGLSQRCKDSEDQHGDAMAYVNSPSVARDMVQMVDKVDELRKREDTSKHDEPHLELKKRTGKPEGDAPRLQYIGFSYGTALGNYFATLYPGRVGRMVLDGVVNADDYANGPGWLSSLDDTDEILEQFWRGCHEAGPSVCALASASDASASDPKGRFWSWVSHLDEAPLPVVTSTGFIVTVTGNDIRKLVGATLYDPVPGFKSLANTLHQAMRGNTTSLITSMLAIGHIPDLDNTCSDKNRTAPLSFLPEAHFAVVCADGDDITNKDAAWWDKYVHRLMDKSKLFGSYWANIRFSCSNWPFRPNLSFKGPFKTPKAVPSLTAGHPAAPLLFLSNRLDPVTPLNSARAMASDHPGAALIIQEAMGHCTIGTAASDCTKMIVADYFEYGTVPSGETICKTQCGPWDENCSGYPTVDVNRSKSTRGQFRDGSLSSAMRMFPLGV